jgi:hypothetical protein
MAYDPVLSPMAIAIQALSIAVQTGNSTILWGPPGIGKTSIVKSMFNSLGVPLVVIMASYREPTEFNGQPFLDENEGTSSFAPPKWAVKILKHYSENGEVKAVFLDEINSAIYATQRALYRFIQEKTVSDDLQLPEETVIVAAANPSEKTLGGFQLEAGLSNRLVHLNWPVDHEYFKHGMRFGWPEICVTQLPQDWQALIQIHKELVVRFIEARPSYLLIEPERNKTSFAWPSPRSWERLAQVWAAASSISATPKVLEELFIGCVGVEVGREFSTWFKQLDLPKAHEILEDPTLIRPYLIDSEDRVDIYHCTLKEAALLALDKLESSGDEVWWHKAWAVVGEVFDRRQDLAMYAVRYLSEFNAESYVTKLNPVQTRIVEYVQGICD